MADKKSGKLRCECDGQTDRQTASKLRVPRQAGRGLKSPCISILWSFLMFQTGPVEVKGHPFAL